jgi:transposase-like protein
MGQALPRDWSGLPPGARTMSVPVFACARRMRRMIRTTNAVVALRRSLSKTIETRDTRPIDDAAPRLIYQVAAGAPPWVQPGWG